MQNFNLGLLATFVAVAETGSFTRAAESIHLTQSTVSLQIRKLEAGLGHSLLTRERGQYGVYLTDEGERLLGYARRLLALAAEAQESMRNPAAPVTVRLGVPEDFAGRRLIGLLARFAHASPGIRLDTVSGWSSELRRQIDNRTIDLALIKREPGDGPDLAHWEEKLVWVGNISSPSGNDPVPLATFPVECIYRTRATQTLDAIGRKWRIAYSSQGLMGVQAAVASGLGISLLPTSAVIREHHVLGPDDGYPDQPPTEMALIGSSPRTNRGVDILIRFLREHMDSITK